MMWYVRDVYIILLYMSLDTCSIRTFQWFQVLPSVTIDVCLFLLTESWKQIGNSCRDPITCNWNGITYFIKNNSPLWEICLDFFKRGPFFLSLLFFLIIIFWSIWTIIHFYFDELTEKSGEENKIQNNSIFCIRKVRKNVCCEKKKGEGSNPALPQMLHACCLQLIKKNWSYDKKKTLM